MSLRALENYHDIAIDTRNYSNELSDAFRAMNLLYSKSSQYYIGNVPEYKRASAILNSIYEIMTFHNIKYKDTFISYNDQHIFKYDYLF